MYKKIATYYDLLGWEEFHDIAYPRLRPLLLKHKTKAYLDLACGTGTLAFTVARMGVDVVGIDISHEMLHQAEKRLRFFTLENKPEFYHRDMTRFNLKRQFDAVGCFFDAANHVVDEKRFCGMIECAARHLVSGGYFIFDVNTARGLKNWDAILLTEKGKHSLLMKGSYDRHTRLAKITIRGYIKLSSGRKDLFREVFFERGYPHAQIMMYLKRAGFGQIKAEAQKSGRSLREARRVFYTAYKK